MAKPRKKKKSVGARDLTAKKNVTGGAVPANRPNTPITNRVDPAR